MKRALITGALGQDGSYLAEHLLTLGYEVWGTARVQPRVHGHYVQGVHYEYADLQDSLSLMKVIRKSTPDEIYNLAGQVFVPNSFFLPAETFDSNVSGLARIIRCVEQLQLPARIYQASTSEMFGNVMCGNGIVRLDETVAMNPVSPYGVSKLAAHKLVDVYRQRGMYIVSGILFNHESPRRGHEMVTRKITRHVAKWAAGGKDVLRLGTITSKRDWGFAGDFVKAMHLMLQQERPDDYVIGTGEANSINDFLNFAIECAGLQGMETMVRKDCPDLARSPELHTLVADYQKAKVQLGWQPEHSFRDLVRMMVTADCQEIGLEVACLAK